MHSYSVGAPPLQRPSSLLTHTIPAARRDPGATVRRTNAEEAVPGVCDGVASGEASSGLPTVSSLTSLLVFAISSVYTPMLRLSTTRVVDFPLRPRSSRQFGLGLKTHAVLTVAGIPCIVVLDSAVAYIMSKCDLALVGAEAVCESGGLVNFVRSVEYPSPRIALTFSHLDRRVPDGHCCESDGQAFLRCVRESERKVECADFPTPPCQRWRSRSSSLVSCTARPSASSHHNSLTFARIALFLNTTFPQAFLPPRLPSQLSTTRSRPSPPASRQRLCDQ